MNPVVLYQASLYIFTLAHGRVQMSLLGAALQHSYALERAFGYAAKLLDHPEAKRPMRQFFWIQQQLI